MSRLYTNVDPIHGEQVARRLHAKAAVRHVTAALAVHKLDTSLPGVRMALDQAIDALDNVYSILSSKGEESTP